MGQPSTATQLTPFVFYTKKVTSPKDVVVAMRQVARARVRGSKFEVFIASNFESRFSRLSRTSRVACLVHLVGLVYQVCFVYLVDLVHLVSFVQPKNETNTTNQTNKTDAFKRLADFFSILREQHSSPERGHATLIAVLRLVPSLEPDSRATHSSETIHR